jgi:hypothetical protein
MQVASWHGATKQNVARRLILSKRIGVVVLHDPFE